MKYRNNNSGFTILEIAVSLTIISVGMIGVLSLVIQSVQIENVDKNRIIASQLAQEGLEVVRNQRDYNWLPNSGSLSWDEDLLPGSYLVDYTGDIIDSVTATSSRLYLNSEGFYDHDDTGTITPFSRIINIEAGTDPTASSSVTCLVEWQDRGNTYEYVADTVLYNWR